MFEEEDESFIPDSLRGFLTAAGQKLQDEIDDVLNFDDEPTQKPVDLEEETEDVPLPNFEDSLNVVPSMDKKQEESFMSPDLISPSLTKNNNPAANLTSGKAKDLALEGVTPQSVQRDLNFELESAQDVVHIVEKEKEEEEIVAKETNEPVEMKVEPEVQQKEETSEEPKEPKVSPILESAKDVVHIVEKEKEEEEEIVAKETNEPVEMKVEPEVQQKEETSEEPKVSPISPPQVDRKAVEEENSSKWDSDDDMLDELLASPPEEPEEVEETIDETSKDMVKENYTEVLAPELNAKSIGGSLDKGTPPRPPKSNPKASPTTGTADLLEYLHPTNDKDSHKLTRGPQQQLFKVPKEIGMDKTKRIVSSPLRVLRNAAVAAANSPMTAASPRKGHSPIASPRLRRELTAPDKNIPSRLLQGTTSSNRNRFLTRKLTRKPGFKKATTTKSTTTTTSVGGPSSRLMQPTRARLLATTKSTSTSPATNSTTTSAVTSKPKVDPRQAAKARLRARVALQKKKTVQENKTVDRKQTVKSTLDRVRARRERLEAIEKERVAKLKAKIEARDKQAKERRLEIQKARSPPMQRKKSIEKVKRRSTSFRPTIPRTPNFQIDKRLKPVERPKQDDVISLANSNDIFKHSFREDLSVGGDSSLNKEPRKLTIPKGPKLKTTTKYGEKQSMNDGEDNSVASATWQTGLRSPSKSQRGEYPPLTIPKTPALKTIQKFGTRRTVDIDDQSVASNSTWQSGLRSPSRSQRGEHPKLTIPKTPQFQSVRRRELPKSTAQKEREEMEYFNSHPFKAKPPKSSQRPRSIVKKSVEKRKVTTPEPFQFSTDRRAGRSYARPPSSHSGPPKSIIMPVDIQRRPTSKATETKPRPYRAKPVPRYLSKPAAIPVKQRDPTKLRSPDSVVKPDKGRPSSAAPKPFGTRSTPLGSPPDPLNRMKTTTVSDKTSRDNIRQRMMKQKLQVSKPANDNSEEAKTDATEVLKSSKITKSENSPTIEDTTTVKETSRVQKKSLESTTDMGGWLSAASLSQAPRISTVARKLPKKKETEESQLKKEEEEKKLSEEREAALKEQQRSQLFEETTRLAAELQRAAENELAFEGTMSARDNLDEGYIGQPTTVLDETFSL